MKTKSLVLSAVLFFALVLAACTAPTPAPQTIVVVQQSVEVAPQAPAAPAQPAAQQPAAVAPTPQAPAAPAQPAVNTTPCDDWNTAAGATNKLLPGFTARGDVVVNGTKHYDNGSGEGTSVENNSNVALDVFAEWGSGCEPTVDTKFLVNKDLSVGCGSSCAKARIVSYTGTDAASLTYKTEYFTNPIP